MQDSRIPAEVWADGLDESGLFYPQCRRTTKTGQRCQRPIFHGQAYNWPEHEGEPATWLPGCREIYEAGACAVHVRAEIDNAPHAGTWADDPRLSFRARGIFAYLVSSGDEQITPENLAARGREGTGAIRTALRELQRFGYVTSGQERGAGGRYVPLRLEAPPGHPDSDHEERVQAATS